MPLPIAQEGVPLDQLRVAAISAAALLLAVVTAILVLAQRRARINRRRRRGGRGRALGWDELEHVRAAGLDPRAATEQDLAEAAEQHRQREWERHVYGRELARYGRAQTRSYCRTHDRYCRFPERGPHPPGGIDNEPAPADWTP